MNEMNVGKKRVIRDVIHGDISFDYRFMAIIDTPEFQRLHRIRQLSTAYFVFPTAEHTRFSHSIGTYQVMHMIIEHFRDIFYEIDHELNETDVDLALAVALLHDLGHGPFSHAFENALPTSSSKDHEAWTREIITNEKSHICQVLKQNFGESFPEEVADLIRKHHDVKGGKEKPSGEPDLFNVLSSLISSQLDADRMDYLLRDAFFTGTTLGRFDIHRLIDALTIMPGTEQKLRVCVKGKYLSAVEEYLLARYQMYSNIYYHPFKTEMETIVQKILLRAKEVYKDESVKEFSWLPKGLQDVFEGRDMLLEDYISLDDSVLIALFSGWKDSNDTILSKLCTAFLCRNKYELLNIMGNKDDNEIDNFKQDFLAILKRNEYEMDKLEQEYFLLLPEKDTNRFYKERNGVIYILKENGILEDIMSVSKILQRELVDTKRVLFYSENMLKDAYRGDFSNASKEIRSLIDYNKERNHIEIEKKYVIEDPAIFDELKNFFLDKAGLKNEEKEFCWMGYERRDNDGGEQTDTYYDTDEQGLLSSYCTLRIRRRKEKIIMTIKTPITGQTGDLTTQQERFEYEIGLAEDDISSKEAQRWINKYLRLKELNLKGENLHPTLKIVNTREKINLVKGKVKIEVAFDDVTYQNPSNGKYANEYQIEMEVKSAYLHQINLIYMAQELEKKFPKLKPAIESKYQRGMKKTK